MVRYIAEHGKAEILEGIEDHGQSYAWAISQFDSHPKVSKLNKKGKVAVALQGVLASYKMCRKRLDVLQTENEFLKKQVEESQSAIKSQHIHANLNAEIQLDLRKEVAELKHCNTDLRCQLEDTDLEVNRLKNAYDYLFEKCNKNGNGYINAAWGNSSECAMKFPSAPIHETTIIPGEDGDRVTTTTTVKPLSPSEIEALVKNIGTFEPAKRDPIEFLANLERMVTLHRLTDVDACVILTACLPHALASALPQNIHNRDASKDERKVALLGVLGTRSVDWEKITEVVMHEGEHPAAYAARLWEVFSSYSGIANLTQQDPVFKSALIAQSDVYTRNALALHIDSNTPYADIVAKMTQLYNSTISTNTSKRKQPVAAIGCETSRNSNHRKSVLCKNDRYVRGNVKLLKGERPPAYNSDGKLVCYACGESGHIARQCERGDSGGAIVCYACGDRGHIARQCRHWHRRETNRVVCFACGISGHIARQCKSSHKRRHGYHELLQTVQKLQAEVALLKGE